MRVPIQQVEARRQELAALLQQQSYLPIREVCRRMKISEATARRDLQALAREKRIVRTFGGALSDFNQRFTSFRDRENLHSTGKSKIAARARDLIQPGTTIYLDAGTTISAIAGELRRRPVTPLRIITNSLPVAESLADIDGVTVHLPGGQLLHRQSVLLGPAACKALAFYQIDLALLSAQGADAAGVWNSTSDVIEQQLTALQHASHHVFCIDRSKIGQTAPVFLAPWSDVETLLIDTPFTRLSTKIPIQSQQYLQA